ncbi:MAG: DUF2586 family protein [Pseudomonadota bacterium]
MSDITMNILDNQLGQLPASIPNALVHAGVCPVGTPNTVYGIGDTNTATSTLGYGPLTEAVGDTVTTAGPCFACPVNPSVAGTVGSTTHLGTGAGTVTASLAPARQVKAKIVLGGALGTMTVQFSVGGAAYGPVFTSTITSYPILVPGTLTVLTFTAHTYTAGDVWTFETDGTSSLVGSGTLGWVTGASSPIDGYDVFVKVTTAGALGVGQFTVSVDGSTGNTTSAPILIPGAGVYVVPGTGIVLTFASTFVLADTYEIAAVAAGFTGGDVTAALTAIGNNANSFMAANIAGAAASAAAAASLAATVATTMNAFEVAFRYMFTILGCPQTEGDTIIGTAFATFANPRVMVCVTDVDHISSLGSAQVIRRNCNVVVASRLASTNPSQDPGFVGGGEVKNVKAIYRNEESTPGLATQRFTVMTSRPTKAGFFVKNGLMMANYGSDFATVMNRRVMDVACTATVGVIVNYLNADLLLNPDDGTIFDPEAVRIERRLDAALGARLISTNPQDATKAFSHVGRTNNIIETANIDVAVSVVPKGYARTITVNIGFLNPGLL